MPMRSPWPSRFIQSGRLLRDLTTGKRPTLIGLLICCSKSHDCLLKTRVNWPVPIKPTLMPCNIFTRGKSIRRSR